LIKIFYFYYIYKIKQKKTIKKKKKKKKKKSTNNEKLYDFNNYKVVCLFSDTYHWNFKIYRYILNSYLLI